MIAFITLLGLIILSGLAYWFLVLCWFRTWGARDQELERLMAAGCRVLDPNYRTTLAVTINAPPRAIWPWLVQMGYRRGRLRQLRLAGPPLRIPGSSECGACVFSGVPATGGWRCDSLRRGTRLSGQSHRTLPHATSERRGRRRALGVAVRTLSLDKQRTRLISRNCVRVPRSIRSAGFIFLIEPAAFIMTRKMLLDSNAAPNSCRRTARRSCGMNGAG